jgi:hypothetical protein
VVITAITICRFKAGHIRCVPSLNARISSGWSLAAYLVGAASNLLRIAKLSQEMNRVLPPHPAEYRTRSVNTCRLSSNDASFLIRRFPQHPAEKQSRVI